MTKVKCLKCDSVIESNGKGSFVQCKCGECYVDETPDYLRIGGDFTTTVVEQDGEWVLLKDTIKVDSELDDDR